MNIPIENRSGMRPAEVRASGNEGPPTPRVASSEDDLSFILVFEQPSAVDAEWNGPMRLNFPRRSA